MAKPKVERFGENGVRLEIEGADPVILYGEPGMDVGELVAAAAARLSSEQSVVVRKPGDVVIEVPEFTMKGENKGAVVKDGEK